MWKLWSFSLAYTSIAFFYIWNLVRLCLMWKLWSYWFGIHTLALYFSCLESSALMIDVETMDLLVWHTLSLYFILFFVWN